MKILYVTPFDIDLTGGVSTSVSMLCAEFAARGHHPTILTPGDRTAVALDSMHRGIRVFRANLRIPHVPEAPFLGAIAFAVYLPQTLLMMWRFLRREEFDVVAVQYPSAWNLYFGILRRFSRWRLVVTFHGNDAHDLPAAVWIDRASVRMLLRRADHVTAVSSSLIQTLRRSLPGVEFESSVVHSGAPEPVPMTHAVPMLLPWQDYMVGVGQLIDRKGFDLVIEALRLMVAGGADARLVLAGEGPARAKLERLVYEQGLTSRVHFLGNQAREAVLDLMRGSSFLVLGSRAEGLPLVVLEAMVCGTAVVATNVDGVGEVVEDGVTGLLVEPERPRALADAMLKLHDDPGLRRRLVNNALARVTRDFSWKTIGGKYLSLFSRVVHGPGADTTVD